MNAATALFLLLAEPMRQSFFSPEMTDSQAAAAAWRDCVAEHAIKLAPYSAGEPASSIPPIAISKCQDEEVTLTKAFVDLRLREVRALPMARGQADAMMSKLKELMSSQLVEVIMRARARSGRP